MSDMPMSDIPMPTDLSDWPDELIDLVGLLWQPTADGQRKRTVHWKIDKHSGAMLRHLAQYYQGHTVDADSGAHPLVHVAWRCLAMAWQEDHRRRLIARESQS